MANTKVKFINKPVKDINGHYTYLPSNVDTSVVQNSDSVPIRYDKFVKNDLYTSVIGEPINEAILDSNIQYNLDNANGSPLRYQASSFIRVDDIIIQHLDSHPSRMGHFVGHIFDKFTYNPFDENGNIKPGRTIHDDLIGVHYGQESEANDWYQKSATRFYYKSNTYNAGVGQSAEAQDLIGKTIITDLNGEFYRQNPTPNNEIGPQYGDFANRSEYFRPLDYDDIYGDRFDIPQGDAAAFNPGEVGDYTTIFSEFNDGNDIYMVFYMGGHQYEGEAENDYRNYRLQVFVLDKASFFEYDNNGDVLSPHDGPITFSLTSADSFDQTLSTSEDGGQYHPSYIVEKLDVTINMGGSLTDDYSPNEKYTAETKDAVRLYKLGDSRDLRESIIGLHPYREIARTPQTINYQSDNPINVFVDYEPVTRISVGNSDKDLQVYYPNINDRLIASAPTTVDFGFYISDVVDNAGELINREQQGTAVVDSKYVFFVIHWNDLDDEFKTWEDVLNDFPTNSSELFSKQNENLYIYEEIPNKLQNSYITPGIKSIKCVMFNYQDKPDGSIEPLRWKLIKSRIYLDIPVNQFPDFGELGGIDYTTIPWPYTTPVIGGVSENSKYLKTIDDTLGSGKIGELDIIDETFLVEAQENNEIGQNIEKLDLEQIRYFNQSYDMNTLLNIPIGVVQSDDDLTLLGEYKYYDKSYYPPLGIYPFGEDNPMDFLNLSTGNAWTAGSGIFRGGNSSIHLYDTPAVEQLFQSINFTPGVTTNQGFELKITGVNETFDNDTEINPLNVIGTTTLWDGIGGDNTHALIASSGDIRNAMEDYLESEYAQYGSVFQNVDCSLTTQEAKIVVLGGYNNNYNMPNDNYGTPDPDTPLKRQFTDNTFGGALSEDDFNALLTRDLYEQIFEQTLPPDSDFYSYTPVPNFPNSYLATNNFYLRIGPEGGQKEIMRIVYHFQDGRYDGNPNGSAETPLIILALERGALNTPILSHFPNELVELGTIDATQLSLFQQQQQGLVFLADYFDFGNGQDGVWVNESKDFRPYLDSMVGSYIRFTIGSIDQDYEGESYTNPPAAAALWPDDPYYYQFVDRQQYNIEVLEVNYNFPVGGVLDSFLTVYQGWRATVEDEFRPSHLFNVSLSGFEYNPDVGENFYPNPHTNVGSGSYWDGSSIERTFSEESSVGQIFIVDNSDLDLIDSCQLELNTGNLSGKAIDDSSGNLNKGLLIGDYKIKKHQRNRPMRRDSFIKIPKKNNNKNGAL